MARNNKILIRAGTSAPSAADFDIAEPAWDKTAGKLYIKNSAGAMVEIAGGGGGGSGSYTASSSPPASPSEGDRWYDIDLGIEFTYVNDGNSSQWVENSVAAKPALHPIVANIVF
jgi:hypothetical protein